MASKATIILAGGGTGGHIYPNIAIAQAVVAMAGDSPPRCLLAVSQRAIDQQVLAEEPFEHVALPAAPPSLRPAAALRFVRGLFASRRLIAARAGDGPVVVLASGGFVSVPVVWEARRRGWPVAVLNLDAVPGKAHRLLHRSAQAVFTVCPQALAQAQPVGFPVRAQARATVDAATARTQLGLDGQRPTLLITAGSQGARSINRMLMACCADPAIAQALAPWQVLHLCGAEDEAALRQAYAMAGVAAKVASFERAMGLAWAAADLVISRAGAGSVAEIALNRVPALFFPYPYHRDGHQALNARPLVEAGGALLCTDHIDPAANIAAVREDLLRLLTQEDARQRMRQALAAMPMSDGATELARWLLARVDVRPVAL